MIIGIIINLIIFAVMVHVVWTFVGELREHNTGTWWERAILASKHSATILWSRLVIVATGLINIIANIAGVIDSGTVEQVKLNIPAEYVAAFVIAIMIITIIARLRTLSGPAD